LDLFDPVVAIVFI